MQVPTESDHRSQTSDKNDAAIWRKQKTVVFRRLRNTVARSLG